MKILLLLLCLIARSSQLSLTDCGAEARLPLPTDISVTCGTAHIYVNIQICPVMFSGYNESLLIMNNILDPACKATLNVNVTPPVASFTFPLNTTNACGSVFTTISTAGTGVFADFSKIQTVNISGVVRSFDATTGTITYNTELKYYYSCAYPLEYLINNTQVDVTSSAIAVKDNNGSFISTLTMKLFSDVNYTQPMVISNLGIQLKTNVYVEVKAINLTGQYNVLLDRCYATISPLPSNSRFFNLFVPCSTGQFTNITSNGDTQSARFSFPAFRFTEQQNQTVSTYYLHCITRLCEISSCSAFKTCSRRKRRDADTTPNSNPVTEAYTVTTKITTQADSVTTTENPIADQQKASPAGGLGVAVGILAFACLTALIIAAVFYRRLRN